MTLQGGGLPTPPELPAGGRLHARHWGVGRVLGFSAQVQTIVLHYFQSKLPHL